jgi:hypothetical protein
VLRSRGRVLFRTSPVALKLLLFYRQMAAHTGASCLLSIPRCETGCDASSHKSAKLAENIELPYLWLRNDGGTEPDRGHSVSFSWPAYPSVGKVARTISARHALLSGKKSVTAHYNQAKFYSRNLINIATETGFRQHHPPGKSGQGRAESSQ